MSVIGSNILAGGSTSGGLPESSISFDGPVISTENWLLGNPAPQKGAAIRTTLPAGVNSRVFTISTWVKTSSYTNGTDWRPTYGQLFTCTGTGAYTATTELFLGSQSPATVAYSPYYISKSPTTNITYSAKMDTFYASLTSLPENNTGVVDMFQAGAWVHVVFVYDSTQAVKEDRIKLWLNGVLWTDPRLGPLVNGTSYTSRDYPALDAESAFISGAVLTIGSTRQYYEFHYVDGAALSPTDFAETNPTTSQWEPVKYNGVYGVAGSYLDFSDGTSVESLITDRSGNSRPWTVSTAKTSPTNGPSGALYPDSAGILASRCLDRPSFTGGLPDTVNAATLDYRTTTFVSQAPNDYRKTSVLLSFVSDGGLSLQGPRWAALPSSPDSLYEGYWSPEVFSPTATDPLQNFQNKGVFGTHGIGPGMSSYYEITIDTLVPGSVLDGNPRPWGIFLGPKNPMPCAWPFNLSENAVNKFGRTNYDAVGVPGNDVHCLNPDTGTIYKYTDGVLSVSVVAGLVAGAGDVISIAANYDAGTIRWYLNGALQHTSTGVANTPEKGEWLPGFVIPSTVAVSEETYPCKIYVNFGSKAFSYAIPTGYKKLTSGNTTEPTFVDPQEAFAAIRRVYQVGILAEDYKTSVSNLKFEPNWMVSLTGHTGQGNFADLDPTYDGWGSAVAQTIINPDATGATRPCLFWGLTSPSFNYLATGVVQSDEYVVNWVPTIGTPPLGYGYDVVPSYNPRAWNTITVGNNDRLLSHYIWKKGTDNTLNQDGNLDSQVSLNAPVGISHFNYTGAGVSASTVGHGLGRTPQAILLQCTTRIPSDATYAANQTSTPILWIDGLQSSIGTKFPVGMGVDYYYPSNLTINAHYGEISNQTIQLYSTPFSSLDPTAKISDNNKENLQYFGTVIASVPGLSKVGSYIGTGVTNLTIYDRTGGSSGSDSDNALRSNFIYLGFRPAFVLIIAHDEIALSGPNAPDSPYTDMSCQWVFDNAFDPRSYKNYGNLLSKNRWAYMWATPYNSGTYDPATINSGGNLHMVANGFYVGGNQWYIGRSETGTRAPQRGLNVKNAVYRYIAFAEVPHKYANGGFPFVDRFDPIVPNTPLP